ncbi:MAG TPA: helix-turn-helix domain-containing protein, partial [Verrucomicrobiae bacterium]|nr:helix-turn-helix domain-containing protein [Verrucomicrobiae bacterium]
MPWEEKRIMLLRREFVMLARQDGSNIRALCRRYGIQPRIGYKWLARYEAQGEAGLADRPRRPHGSPDRTPAAVEAKVLALRRKHPCWGGRKLRRRLLELGEKEVPSASTVTAILHRHGLIDPQESAQRMAVRRFERAAPNELWQMDYKGHFATAAGRCHPLTVLDDHSRFALAIAACADERSATVQTVLTGVFRRYGLPERMLM